MSNTKRLTTSIILLAFLVSSSRADDAAETTDPPAEAKEVKRQPALVVYQRLFKKFQAGKSNGLPTLELLRSWSLRVAGEPIENLQFGFPQPEGAVTEAKKTITKAMESHSKRMEELGKIVRVSYKAGKAEYLEVAAVEYYIAEADRLPQTFETLQHVLYQGSESEVIMPEVDARTPLLPSKEIIVYVDAKGRIKVRGKKLTLDQFKKLLQNKKSDGGKLSLILRCDPRVKNRDVVAITEIAGEFSARLSIAVVEELGSEQDE